VFGALAVAGPAQAQTTPTYQGQCNVTTGSVNAGSHNVGDSFRVTLAPTCVFTPGAAVTVTVNGQAVGTKTATANGTVSVAITVVSSTQVSIDDPVSVTAQCGSNSVVGSGPSSVANSNVTQSASFTINCPASTATASKGTVAFTGANIAKWSAGALVLVAAGFGLVLISRRRKTNGSVTA
jgi:hypothetical protein